jgi:hypothetical protein
LFAWFVLLASRDAEALLHSHSLYPAFKDARTILAIPLRVSRFPSDHRNLDRGRKLEYHAHPGSQVFFCGDGPPVFPARARAVRA